MKQNQQNTHLHRMTFTMRIGSYSYRVPGTIFDKLKTRTIVGLSSSLKANELKTLEEPMFNCGL